MDLLVVRLAHWARSAGYETLNLGMAPFGAAPIPSSRFVAWAVASARRFGGGLYNFDGLRQFKAKFRPRWRTRYFAAPPGLATATALVDLLVLVSGGWRGVLWK